MIIVMGLPGAGKSTVLSAAEKKGWKVLNYGTLMMEIASKEYGVKDRDQLRKLPAEKQKKIQKKVGDTLAKIKEREVILDTHCSINTPKGYLPGLPFSLLSKLDVERLVLVSAPISDIMGRREKDKTRIRDGQSEQSLREHDDINRAYLASYSVVCAAPALIIMNSDGKLEEAREKFSSLLE